MTQDDQPIDIAPTSSDSAPTQPVRPVQEDKARIRPFPHDLVSFILILLVLLLGAYFRFSGLNWDHGTHLHPDERFLTGVTTQIQTTSNPLTYLSSSESPLNPYNVGQTFYVYGNFPMTVTRYVAEWANSVCTAVTGETPNPDSLCANNFTAYDGVHLLGRFLSGLLDLISVFFLFLIGRRLYDWRVGVLAALLLAAAVMPIQQSHFYTMDNWAAALTTIAVYTAVRAAGFGDEQNRWHLRWWVLFGIALGLAVASRINVAPLAVIAPVAAVIWLARRGYQFQDFVNFNNWRNPAVQQALIGLVIAALVSLLTFRLAQPYAFADAAIARQDVLDQTGQEPGALSIALRSFIGFNPQWLANMDEIQRLQTPDASFPPAVQWADREPILFPLTNMILYGMGLTAGLAAWAGLLWALWRIVHARPDWMAHAIPVVWSGLYFLFMGTRWVKSVRYFLPIYPTLLLLAAWLLVELWQRASQAKTRTALKRVGVIGLMALTIIPSLLWANAFIKTYTEPFTRLAASDWIYENIPSGVTVLYEVDGRSQTLNVPLKSFDFYEGSPLNLGFSLPQDGVITGIRLNYLTTINGQPGQSTLQVQLNGADFVPGTFDLDGTRRAAAIELPGTAVTANQPNQLTIELDPGSPPVHADTSLLVNESWDDLLPVNSNGRSAYGSYYTEVSGGQRPLPATDSEIKRQEMIQWLDEADYIPISSQRAIWSVPRIPLSFPMTTRYYEALFSGELGYELVAQFHANFQIG
ncbi:MAG: glycosyltransferase family 39 protein, partial [Ardenticatenaceae bacterium]|nr:glycosyltransferase family 39 protein [Ardenticatenaceae bacterium]